MEYIKTQCPFVVGLPHYLGGSGDPSPATAYGVMKAMEACAKEVFGEPDLKGKVIAIQGVGKVGSHLAELLHEAGAKLIIAEIDKAALQKVARKTGARVKKAEDIVATECDIFSPCALGGILNSQNITRLRCKIIVGAANNQLQDAINGEEIHQRGILYCPDYVANAGGIINLALELTGYNEEVARSKLEKIFDTTQQVIEKAKREGISTSRAADLIAEERIMQAKKVKNPFYQAHVH
jgi:leucine dehydrogenase